MKAFYFYRLPGETEVHHGMSDHVIEGISGQGFVIAPFDPESPYLTIPDTDCLSSIHNADIEFYPFPECSTTPGEHSLEIKEIQSLLKMNGGGKTIAARVIVEDMTVNLKETFSELCKRNPDAFVFCFSTPQTGCWIGASPELLLKSSSGSLETVALAGTRPAGAHGEWDFKNIEEQQMVSDFIAEVLISHNLKPEISFPHTRRAGKVEHLATKIQSTPDTPLNRSQLNSLLNTLSPTPALCGTDRKNSLKIIEKYEGFSRGCYGGFCGPYISPENFSFFVTLRCCAVKEDSVAIFSGGGITLRSNPADEWEETEMKAATIRDSLQTQ